jgi:hypothetical protein
MAAMPTGIEACLKPAVLENTRTFGLPSLLLLQLNVKKAQHANPQNNFFMFFLFVQFSIKTFAKLPI